MSEKRKIAVDIDEVVLELVEKYLKFVEERGFGNFEYNDIFTYKFWNVLDVEKEVIFDLMREYNKSEYFKRRDFVNGAKEGVNFLLDNFDVYFITSRPKEISKETREIIFEEFGVLGDRVIFSGDAWGGAKSKDDICKDLGIDLIIEDSEEDVLKYARNGIRVLKVEEIKNEN